MGRPLGLDEREDVGVTAAGCLPITVKNTFRSKACAVSVFGLARAATNRRYSSSHGSPSRGTSPAGRTRHGRNAGIAGLLHKQIMISVRPT